MVRVAQALDSRAEKQPRKSLTRNRHRAEYKGVSAIACDRPAATFMRFRGPQALNDRVEINKLVRKKGTKAGRQRHGGGRVKTRGI